jgi:hypothetical protein
MEVYSDRIGIDQDEQERLRFSPDDILRLPVYQAINLWIADGTPKPGFVAHTLPMEALHDAGIEQHHRAAQRQRGGYHPDKLPDLLAYDDDKRGQRKPEKPSSTQGDARNDDADGTPPEDENGQTRIEGMGD